MKKQINLYQPSCYPKREKATFAQFLLLMLCCIIASFSVYFLTGNQSSSLNQKLVEHNALLQNQQSALSALVIELQKNRAPDDKLRLATRLDKEIQAKQRLLASLAYIDVKELVSFSALMRALSLADTPDLSINHFSMVEGIVNIKGQAKESDSVPLWLSDMQLTPELSRLAFTALSIEQEKRFFTFELSNRDPKGNK